MQYLCASLLHRLLVNPSVWSLQSVKFTVEVSTYLKGHGDLWQWCGFLITRGKPRFLLTIPSHTQPPTSSEGNILASPSQKHELLKSKTADWTSVFRNTIIIIITTLLWSFSQLQENRKSLCFMIRESVFHSLYLLNVFSIICVAHSFARLLIHTDVSFAVLPDDANIVSESTEIMDVSPSITTNIIGQKTEEANADMCERSCEELSTMFQELKGLRVVVSNLIDGLQKVVSSRSNKCNWFSHKILTSVCFRVRNGFSLNGERKLTF